MSLYRPVLFGALLALATARTLSAQPMLAVTPTRVDFSPPSIMLGRGSPEIPVELRNVGSANLSLQVALGGIHAGDFRRSSCGRDVLAPSGVCVIFVSFRPTMVGTRQGELVVRSNDPTSRVVAVPLVGNARPAAPILEVSPASLTFPPQLPGTTSDPQRIDLRNLGTSGLQITGITSSRPEFLKTTACDAAAIDYSGPAMQCSFEVRFAPSVAGPVTGTIIISSDDPNGPVSIPIAGTGAGPGITVTPTPLNFGSREVGTSGNARQVTITNTGNAPLVVTGAAIGGAQAVDFRAVALPCTAPPQGTCTIQVNFTPWGSGPRAGELTISSNAAPARIALQGFGELIAAAAPPPATNDDHSFLAGSIPGGCMGNGQRVTFTVPVTRAVGAVGPAGTLAAPGPAVASGALSATATLELMVWDTGTVGQHRVSLNGTPVATVPAAGRGWFMHRVTAPIGLVRFPARGAMGMAPTPATNTVAIDPDSGGAGSCISVAWARLWFLAISPVILVHGNGSTGAFFIRQGFVGALDAAGIPNDASISLTAPPGGSAPIAANAAALQAALPLIVRSFGVNSVHLLAHSKGGLDAREWLGASGATSPFRVISLTTLSTPHRGSALADLALAVTATGLLYGLTYADLIAMGVLSAGYPDLTTFATAAFNSALPAGADYRTIGADADINGDRAIGSAPRTPVEEYAAARAPAESAALAAVFALDPATADALVSAVYGFLRSTRSVTVQVGFVPVACPPPCPVPVVPVRVAQPVPVPGGAPNDLLVTVPSAMPPIPPFVPAAPPLVGVAGRDHASVANAGVVAIVIPLLLTSDATRGDLRRTP